MSAKAARRAKVKNMMFYGSLRLMLLFDGMKERAKDVYNHVSVIDFIRKHRDSRRTR